MIVGAGPGDPELLTLKALKTIQQADVILYDSLINKSILEFAKSGCDLIYVGKKCGKHLNSQDEISWILVQCASRYARVVRLKGGDPLVFGRGGEEALALAEAGFDFEFVPGVSSAIAAATSVGIPVTHRHLASSIAVIAGRETRAKLKTHMNWSAFVGIDTLVFMMAVATRQKIAFKLIEAGRPKMILWHLWKMRPHLPSEWFIPLWGK